MEYKFLTFRNSAITIYLLMRSEYKPHAIDYSKLQTDYKLLKELMDYNFNILDLDYKKNHIMMELL